MLYGTSVLWKVDAKIWAPSQICCFSFTELLLTLRNYAMLRSVYEEELCYMGHQYYEKLMQKFGHLPRFVAFPSKSCCLL